MDKNIVVLEYQNSFSDNLSNIAYASILEEKFNVKCVYENTTSKRDRLENMMKDLDMTCSYISKARVDEIKSKSLYMDYRDINSNKKINKNILNIPYFKIEDIDKINEKIKKQFSFNNTNFIINYDILEDISNNNSIGLYLDEDEADLNYIHNAIYRLNKYLKHPKLYIFSKKEFEIEEIVPYTFLNLNDYREEFYFLQKCKNKIIYCSKKSYSTGFWASVLSDFKGYTIYNKNKFPNTRYNKWIGIN